MNAGAAKARGHILLFLHADSILPAGYSLAALELLRSPAIAVGAFRFAVAESFRGSKLLEWSTNLRSRWRQMPYGDQALFVRRALFEELGGFADLPILEDYEFVRRSQRNGRIVTLSAPVLTSARRWQRLGFLRTTLINKWVILGYRLGWPIEKLAATYRRAERPARF
jgi:rSAM/selenodomain-associated transferase 2